MVATMILDKVENIVTGVSTTEAYVSYMLNNSTPTSKTHYVEYIPCDSVTGKRLTPVTHPNKTAVIIRNEKGGAYVCVCPVDMRKSKERDNYYTRVTCGNVSDFENYDEVEHGIKKNKRVAFALYQESQGKKAKQYDTFTISPALFSRWRGLEKPSCKVLLRAAKTYGTLASGAWTSLEYDSYTSYALEDTIKQNAIEGINKWIASWDIYKADGSISQAKAERMKKTEQLLDQLLGKCEFDVEYFSDILDEVDD